jgi:hypothetical protein
MCGHFDRVVLSTVVTCRPRPVFSRRLTAFLVWRTVPTFWGLRASCAARRVPLSISPCEALFTLRDERLLVYIARARLDFDGYAPSRELALAWLAAPLLLNSTELK